MATEITQPSPFGDLTSILDIIKQFTGTQTDGTTTTGIGGTAAAGLQELLNRLLPSIDSGEFSPDAAVKDSQGLVQDIMRQLQEGTLPQIYNQQNAAGAYNSTTGQLLANDASARAAAQGAAAVSGTKEKYAGVQNTQMGQLMQIVQALIAANKSTNTTTTSGKPAGSPASNLAKAALGAAAANAAKKATSPPKPTKAPKPDDGSGDNKTDDSSAVEKAITDAYKENGGQQQYDENSGDQITKDILDSLGGNPEGTGAPGDPNASDIPSASNEADAFGGGDPLALDNTNSADPAAGAPDTSNMDDMFGDFNGIDLSGLGNDNNNELDPNAEINIDNSDNGDFSIIDDGGDDFS